MERKSARKKHKAARARSRLQELTLGTFNVRTAAVNGVNGIDLIDTLLRTCAAKGCDVIGLQETKRDGTSEIYKALHGRLKSQRDGTGGKLTVDPPFSFRRERGTGKI